MKRWKLVFAVACVLLLCACGSKKQVSGRVLAFENGILTVQTEKGKSYDFLVEDLKTAIFNLADGGQEEPLDENCRVQVTWERKQGQRVAKVVWIHARLKQNAMQLSDGTSIDIWESTGYRDYCLKDGTILLMEETSNGPENASRWNELLYNEDFSEAAQQGIINYYGEMGLRYDVTALLEDAWLVYDLSEAYNTKLVGQYTWVEAWNEDIICCHMNLTIPVERSNGGAEYFCEGAVFDRKTGEYISNYDLFALTPEELEEYLLDYLDSDGTLNRKNLQLNLKPEQILLLQDGGIEFYLVDRVDNGLKSMLQIGLPPVMAQQILHPWAVVAMEDKTREM